MTLKQYLESKDLSPYSRKPEAVELCEHLGISRQMLGYIATGKKRPSGLLALRIEDATDGQVTVRELLMPDDEEEQEAA